MKEDVNEKIKKLQTLIYSKSECAIPGFENKNMEKLIAEHGLSDPENSFLNNFFYVSEEDYKNCVNVVTAGMPLYRYFVGLGSYKDEAEKKKIESIYKKCVKDIEKLEALEDLNKKIKAENKLAEKYNGYLIYKNDDIVSIIASYKICPHSVTDRTEFEQIQKKTKRLLKDTDIKELNDIEKIKAKCKAKRIKYEEQFAKGIMYFSELLLKTDIEN